MRDKTKYGKNDAVGFTLIELILYVALVSVFITSVVIFWVSIVNSRVKAATEEKVIVSTREVSRRIEFEIRNASGLNSVGTSSLSLASTNSSRNPTVIDLSGGRVRLGYGSSGPCPVSSPCFLTPSDVVVQSLNFYNMSDAGGSSASVRFFLTESAQVASGSLNWSYQDSMSGSGEVRSK